MAPQNSAATDNEKPDAATPRGRSNSGPACLFALRSHFGTYLARMNCLPGNVCCRE